MSHPEKLPRRVALVLLALLVFLLLVLIGGWLLAVVMAAVAAALVLGYGLAYGESFMLRARLDAERRALDAEWRALDQTRRVRAVFLQARRAMQAEARRQHPDGWGASS